MSKQLEVGQNVFISPEVNPVWTGDAVLKNILEGTAIVEMTTGRMAGKRGGFNLGLVVANGIKIISLKRSTHRTGLKVYGKVLGESGKEYNVAYFRRPNFRGWICSCESFFFTMFAKKRNCKHLRFVRKEVGRFAASVK